MPIDIAEHSMCQPGRPSPHGDGQAGSSSQRRLPEDEVEGVAQPRVVGIPAPLGGEFDHVLVAVAGESTKARKRRHVEEDGSVDRVGVTLLCEHLDEVDHVGDPSGRVGFREHRPGVEGQHVAVEAGGLGCSEFEEVDTQFSSFREDRIVDIGDVSDEFHFVAKIFEPADQEVIGEVCVRVTEVGRVVGRDATDIHPDLGARLERDDLIAGRVEKLHGRPP
jgi:hypothetical protein